MIPSPAAENFSHQNSRSPSDNCGERIGEGRRIRSNPPLDTEHAGKPGGQPVDDGLGFEWGYGSTHGIMAFSSFKPIFLLCQGSGDVLMVSLGRRDVKVMELNTIAIYCNGHRDSTWKSMGVDCTHSRTRLPLVQRSTLLSFLLSAPGFQTVLHVSVS